MGQNNASPFKRRYLVGIVLAIAAVAAAAYFFNIGRQAVIPPGPPEKVTIAYSATADVILAAIAKVRDFYREEGLEATARLHPYGRPALQDVLEGKADVATVAETPVMFAIMKGERISVIATIQTTNQGNAVVARRDRASVLSEASGDGRSRRRWGRHRIIFWMPFWAWKALPGKMSLL